MFSNELPPEVLQALEQGRKIEAIKRLREQRNMGLKQARETVEAYLGEHPEVAPPQGQRVDMGLGRLVVAALVVGGLYLVYRFFF